MDFEKELEKLYTERAVLREKMVDNLEELDCDPAVKNRLKDVKYYIYQCEMSLLEQVEIEISELEKNRNEFVLKHGWGHEKIAEFNKKQHELNNKADDLTQNINLYNIALY